MSGPLLEVKGLHIGFGGKDVVHGIDFALHPGEKLALVGESGSGKTVTALSLLRLLDGARVQGSARFALPASAEHHPGQNVDLLALPERELRAIRGQEIAMIFQEPMTALNPLMAVGDQIAEVLQLKQGLSGAAAAQAAIQLIADTGVLEAARRSRAFPHQLSGGQRQRIMIAMALACQPALLLADEPTTALDVTLRVQILDLLGALQQRNGMAIMLITHDLNLVRRFADRVAVMQNGRIVEQGAVGAIFANPQHPYTRKLIASKPERDLVVSQDASPPIAVLQARNLRVTYPVKLPGLRGWFKHGEFVAVNGANFAIQAGQTLGVVGESGSGKSTLALATLGLQPFTGHLQLLGSHWQGNARRNTSDNQHIRCKVQVVFQDPYSSLSPRMTVEEIVGEGLQVHQPGLLPDARRALVQAALADVGLTDTGLVDAQFSELLSRYPHEFSGGQRQRIAIARALIVQPRLLVLDEPTSALDVTIQKTVLQLLQRLQRERGLSYLLITHDVDVIRAMAHQVIVMKDGDVVESGPVGQVLDAPQHVYTQKLVAASLLA